MGSTYAMIFCSLLLWSDGTVPPNPQGQLPAVQQVPFVSTQPTVPIQPAMPMQTAPITAPPVAVPTTNARQARFTNGVSMPTRSNRAVVPASESAVLMSLTTEQRDAAGTIMRDSDGNPIMVPLTLGMTVFQGQVLGKLNDRALHSILRTNQAQLEVAKAERDKKLEVILAAHGVQVAYAELDMMLTATKQIANAYSQQEIRRATLARTQAEVNLELQKYNIEEVKTREVIVAESKVEQTEDQIELRQLVTPIEGMIVKINATEGEWLQEGHKVLEIMRLDTLWVQVFANVKEYERSDLDGKQAVVQLTLPNGRTETFRGTVVFCDLQVDGSDRFEVLIEVQNRRAGNFWLFQPGRKDVEVLITL